MSRFVRASIWQPPGNPATLTAGLLRLDDTPTTIISANIVGSRLEFLLPDSAQYGWHGLLIINGKHEVHITLAPDIDVDLPEDTVIGSEFGLLSKSGKILRDGNNSIWRYRGSTDFKLFQKFLDRENIDSILDDRISLGTNVFRVAGMYDPHIGRFYPQDYGDGYYDVLSEFADYLANRQVRFQFDVFLDAQIVMPNVSQQVAHYNKIAEVLIPKWNVVPLSLGNEYPQNGFNPGDFNKPGGILSSAGSTTGDLVPSRFWDLVPFHPARRDDWYRSKGGKDLQDGHNVLVYEDEPMGADEILRPGSRDNVPIHFYWYASMLGLFLTGGTFHSTDGVFSNLFRINTKECARNFYDAIMSYPAEITEWHYTAGHLHDYPLVPIDLNDLSRRSFGMINGNHAFCMKNNISEGNTPQNGWNIVGEWGPNLSSIELTR